MRGLATYIILIFMCLQIKSQYLSYDVREGDTINRIDKDTLKQGVWRNFYPGGKLKTEVVFKNNKKQGLEIQWHNNLSNCVKQETYYNNGVLDGPITYYSKNCKKDLIEYFKNGVKEGIEISYHSNGNMNAE